MSYDKQVALVVLCTWGGILILGALSVGIAYIIHRVQNRKGGV